jgi:hypothetical protein
MLEDIVEDGRVMGEAGSSLELLELALESFRSAREVWRLFTPSVVYDGLLEFTILPVSSLQSLLRVARTPSPSPPASSSFSLWRAICLSVVLVRKCAPK